MLHCPNHYSDQTFDEILGVGRGVDSLHCKFEIVTAAVFEFGKIIVYYKIKMLSNL